MRIALYIRVSTAVQFEKGNSVPEQKKRLQAYCESRGWSDYDFFIDPGHSGSNLARPGLQKMLDSINAYSLVLVYKLDRLSRNQRDILYLIEDVFQKNGVEFNSITENFDTSTPVGKLMLSMMGAFAELERQQINERMTMGRIAAAGKGKWRGGSGVPTGYIYSPKSSGGSGRLEIDESKARFVRKMFDLCENGYSLNHIKEEMERCGLHISSAHGVKQILTNPIYIGLQKYAGEVYPSEHPPIIAEEQFARVQEAVKDRTKASIKSKHLLTGFLYCSCGSRVCYHKTGKYDYYECYTRMANKQMRKAKKCKNKIWRAAELEELVWNVLEDIEYEDVKTEAPDLITPKRKELQKIENKINKVMDLFLIDKIPQSILVERLESLNREKDAIFEEITALEKGNTRLSKQDLKEAQGKLQAIKDADVLIQRAFIGSMIEKITLLPAHDVEFRWKF